MVEFHTIATFSVAIAFLLALTTTMPTFNSIDTDTSRNIKSFSPCEIVNEVFSTVLTSTYMKYAWLKWV